MSFLDALGSAKATGIAILVWAIGLFLAGGAALEARIKADDRTKINLVQQSTPAKLIVRDESVSAAEYNKAAQALRALHPDVNFSAGGQGRQQINGVKIEINNLAAYNMFITVIYDTMVTIPDARWDISYLCAGEGCSTRGAPYQATLTASRKSTQMQ